MEQQVTADDGIQDAAFTIAGWSVDLSTLRIHKQDKSVKLEPKVMAVLEYLASRSGQVVSRQDLEQAVWAGTVVGYDAISNAIIKLRKAFGDDAHHPQFIETIPKTGYRLIAPVEVQPGNDLQAPDSSVVGISGEAVNVKAASDDSARPGYWKTVVTVTASLLILLTLVSVLLEPWVSKVEPASIDRMAFPLPDKPSIAVLPFTNMSADVEQEYFVDGITEDLITDLSKLEGLFVVARNSVFTYKGKAVKIRQVAEELGVRYVLEGSARLSGDQVRINAQLIDALSGGHIWAERYDGGLDDVFKLQDQVSREIVKQLAINLSLEDNKAIETRAVIDPEAYNLFLKGWGHYRAGSAGDYSRAIAYLEKSLDKDPAFNRAQAALAAVYLSILSRGWWQESLGVHYYDAFELARKSLRRSQEHPTALTHQIASEWITHYSRSRNPRRALEQAEEALRLDPNSPAGYLAKANALLNDNQARKAQRQVRIAMRLDPHFPSEYRVRLALTQIQLGQYQSALELLNKAITSNPDDGWTQVYLAVVYGLLNRREEAREAIDLANQLRASDGWGPVTIVSAAHPYFRWFGDRDKLKQGLRTAGVTIGGEWFKLITYTVSGEINLVEGARLIDTAEAKALHDRGAVFVDVAATWLSGHIPSAHFLEWWGEGWLFNEATLKRIAGPETEIVIYALDKKGKRTSQAAALAVSRGFDKVYQYPGGLDAWKAAGYPVEKPN
jgi:TolB-like protein/DNA-binding winged helix-turn-helix (wHTH) protein/Tfp pilus assembly protein PilF/rhodanese-related sulfurtransferase